MSLPATMDSEDAPHPESHKLECTRRDDKIRLIAVTLPSLNGMAENLMDPPTVRPTKRHNLCCAHSNRYIFRFSPRMPKPFFLLSTKCVQNWRRTRKECTRSITLSLYDLRRANMS